MLTNIRVDGHILLGTFKTADGSIEPVAVDLRTRELLGLDTPLVAKKGWKTAQRYFAWIQTAGNGLDEELYVYDLSTGEKIRLNGEGGSQCCADVSGNTVVWSERHGDNRMDIYTYNLASSALKVAVARPGSQVFPKIEGDWVVYTEYTSLDFHNEDGPQTLYLHNLATGEDFSLGLSWYAVRCQGCTYGIANQRVVWNGLQVGDPVKWPYPIHVYDLKTHTTQTVDTSAADCSPWEFALSGNLIQWACDQMVGYDLERKVFFEFSALPKALGDKIGGMNIYLSQDWIVWSVVQEKPTFTPSAPTSTRVSPRLLPIPRWVRLFAAPITRQ
jgi:hypothetical protein